MSYTLDFSLNLGTAYAGKTDMRAQLVDTTGANVGSAVSTGFTEIGTSSGFYLWHYTAIPDAHRGGVKFYSNAASTTILAFASINPEEAEYTDSKISAVAAAVWAVSVRTLTSFGTLAADIWSYATRQLTTTANNQIAEVDGSEINITIGATFTATISGLSISASWTKMYFTVKCQHSDLDAESLIQIVVTNPSAGADGLKYLNQATATANQGSLVVNQAAGTVAITLADDAAVLLEEQTEIYYDLKQLVSSASNILTSGTCNIVPAVTLAIS